MKAKISLDDTFYFAGSYFFWNMVLDESGLSRWNWKQNCLIAVDRRAQTVNYNHGFQATKHFSATVRPGAQRIAVSGGPFKEMVAFQNADGSKVLAFASNTAKTMSDTAAIGRLGAVRRARTIHEHGFLSLRQSKL